MQFLYSDFNDIDRKRLLTASLNNDFNYYDKFFVLDETYPDNTTLFNDRIERFEPLDKLDIDLFIKYYSQATSVLSRSLLVIPDRILYATFFAAWFKFICPYISINASYIYYINSYTYSYLNNRLIYVLDSVEDVDFSDKPISKEEWNSIDLDLVDRIARALTKYINKENITISFEVEFVRAKFLKDSKSFKVVQEETAIYLVRNLIEQIGSYLCKYAESTDLENPIIDSQLIQLCDKINEFEDIDDFKYFYDMKDLMLELVKSNKYIPYNADEFLSIVDDIKTVDTTNIDEFNFDNLLKIEIQRNEVANLNVWFMSNCTEDLAKEFSR